MRDDLELATEQPPGPLPFEKMVKRYKRDHLKNVAPEIRRHSAFMSRGERRRLAKKKSASRIKRAAARQREAAQRFIRDKLRGK